MKKNVMMRVASALLVAVLMTTCAISGTFAKYTTTASGSDTARVAKWGFETNSIAIDMFDGQYSNVNAATNVVAPGTTKTATITFAPTAGTPEVAYTFDVNVTVETSNDALVAKLVWKLNGAKAGENGTFAELVAAVNEACDKDYAPGETPENISIGWEWPFEVNDAGNESDTVLGNGADTLEVTVTYTATQK